MRERLGEAFEFDEKLTAVGDKLQAGDTAPDFALDHFDPATGAPQIVHLSDTQGKIRLLNVINSIDTPVCHIETHKWEDFRTQELPADVIVYTISMDLGFAQARWAKSENVTHQALSGHKSEAFGQAYGVLLKEWRLLQRAVFVIDRNDTIVYAEYVNDQMKEPDYTAAIEAARAAV